MAGFFFYYFFLWRLIYCIFKVKQEPGRENTLFKKSKKETSYVLLICIKWIPINEMSWMSDSLCFGHEPVRLNASACTLDGVLKLNRTKYKHVVIS